MLKLYLQKLLYTLLFFLMYSLLGGCIAFVCYILLGKRIYEDIATITITVGAFLIALRIVYKRRCASCVHKSAFWVITETGYITLAKDFVQTLKSRKNTVHTLAFLTLVFLFCLPIGIWSSSSVPIFMIGTLLLLAAEGILFTLGNTLLWCLVHRRWQNIKMRF